MTDYEPPFEDILKDWRKRAEDNPQWAIAYAIMSVAQQVSFLPGAEQLAENLGLYGDHGSITEALERIEKILKPHYADL
jgi:hypothetical protein